MDTAVISHSPHATDPDLVDVVVSTGVIEHSEVWPGDGPGTMPAVPRLAVAEEDYRGGPIGACHSIDGLLAPCKVRPDIPLQLIGCEPGERLPAALRNPQAWTQEWGGQWWHWTGSGGRWGRIGPVWRSGAETAGGIFSASWIRAVARRCNCW